MLSLNCMSVITNKFIVIVRTSPVHSKFYYNIIVSDFQINNSSVFNDQITVLYHCPTY